MILLKRPIFDSSRNCVAKCRLRWRWSCAILSLPSPATRSSSQPAGMRVWRANWRPILPPKPRTWIAPSVVSWPAQKRQRLGLKFEEHYVYAAVVLFRAEGQEEMEHRMKRIAYIFLAE